MFEDKMLSEKCFISRLVGAVASMLATGRKDCDVSLNPVDAMNFYGR
jgi:hypothetical protein